MHLHSFHRVTAIALGVCLALLPALVHAGDAMYWRKVDYYVAHEGKPDKHDARLVLDPATRTLSITDENHPELATYVALPYDAITSANYSFSKHPRWKTGIALLIPLSIFAIPFFFLKGKKHWLSLTFEGVPEHPEGFLVLRLDKNNYLQILAAVEGQAGVQVERVSEK